MSSATRALIRPLLAPLLATLLDLQRAGRKIVLFTLAEQPPAEELPGMTVYHLPHLVDSSSHERAS